MIPYYHFAPGQVAGVECFLSRTGYTGEDGFELYCRGADLERLWRALVGPGRGEPCGLGARDTLRLEAGYPLDGNDIDDTGTPLQAGPRRVGKVGKGAGFVRGPALEGRGGGGGEGPARRGPGGGAERVGPPPVRGRL